MHSAPNPTPSRREICKYIIIIEKNVHPHVSIDLMFPSIPSLTYSKGRIPIEY